MPIGNLGVPRIRIPVMDRVAKLIRIDLETGCWFWMGNTSNVGRGRISMPTSKSRSETKDTKRVIYQECKGEIPTGGFLANTCRNPQCYNPEHLFVTTMQGAMLINREPAVGSRHGRSKLFEVDALRVRDLRSMGYSMNQIAKEFGVNISQISRICRGKSWKHTEDLA